MEQHEGSPHHEGKHAKHAKVRHAEEVAEELAVPDEPPESPPVVAAPVQAPTVASVGVPTTATDELSKLIPANGQISGLTVVLAAVAVLGGGAAWKFYSQRSKERHEQKMRELELNAQPPTQHPSCKAENEAIQTELRKLNESVGSLQQSLSSHSQNVTERITRLESKAESPDLPEGMEDIENRLKKMERAIKTVKARKT